MSPLDPTLGAVATNPQAKVRKTLDTTAQAYRRCANTSSSRDLGHPCLAAPQLRCVYSYGSVAEGAVPGLALFPLHRAALSP